MTDALSTPERPPNQGPGSDMESWRAYAAHVTGRAIEGDLDKFQRRDELIALVDQAVAPEAPREAPDGVEVHAPEEDDEGRERPPAFSGPMGPQWAVPVEGGYVPEDELIKAEREREKERLAERHRDQIEQLRTRDEKLKGK